MEFSNDVAKALEKWFPKTNFLKALEIVNPSAWRENHDPRFRTGPFNFLLNFYLLAVDKLHPDFMDRCNVLQMQYHDLLEEDFRPQFEMFLANNQDIVRHMNERDFLKYMLRQTAEGPYQEFVW